MADIDDRLLRIEQKVDKVSEAIVSLARAEERIANLSADTRIILKRMVSQDDRLRVLERDLSHVEDTTKTLGTSCYPSIKRNNTISSFLNLDTNNRYIKSMSMVLCQQNLK